MIERAPAFCVVSMVAEGHVDLSLAASGYGDSEVALLRGHHADGDETVNPAGGAFFAGGDQLQRTAIADGLSVHGVGDENGSVMNVRRDFGNGIDDLITVGALSN